MIDREVVDSLTNAGWFPGRRVDITALERLGLSLFPAAKSVLQEFFGLHIGVCGPGKECATSDVLVDPSATTHLLEELREYEQLLGVRLFPLGEVHRSYGFLLIDERGRTYLLSDEIIPFARSFDDSLEKLVKGLLPDKA